jgi:fatty acid desaturase
VAVFLVGNSWAVLVVAAFLAVMFIQVVFVGHDAGHQQIFHSRRANRMVGLVAGNTLTGLSFGWWVAKHNAHHAHPNQVDRDPDIGPGVIAFTAEIACRRRGIGRFLARRQAWLFFPLLTFEGLALHVASIRILARRRNRAAAFEGLLLAAHAALYLGVVFWLLSPTRALAFIAIQQALFGLYLGCTFAPNHKGMAMLDHDANETFLRRQVITSRNVTGGAFITLLLGGLNYQIEHHLFPMMPRSNLARSQGVVREFCLANGVPYQTCSLIHSYRQVLTYLRAVGAG